MRFLKVVIISACALLCVGCAAKKPESNDSGTGEEVNLEQADPDKVSGCFAYEIDEEKGTSSVVSCLDEEKTEVVIPESFTYEGKDYSVTSIAQEAFYNNIVVKKVTIPDTVTSIGQEAFCMCDALESVNIPGSAVTLGTGAFYGCSSLEKVTLGKGIVNLPDEFFSNCYALKEIKLPKTLTAIGSEVFWQCENLSELELPKSVVSIGERTFYSSGIKTLKILSPSVGVTENTLEGADEIKEIYVPESLVDTISGLVDDESVAIKTLK